MQLFLERLHAFVSKEVLRTAEAQTHVEAPDFLIRIRFLLFYTKETQW